MIKQQHDVESANISIKNKNLGLFLKVVSINNSNVKVEDVKYGVYTIDIQHLAPSMPVPLHKKRRTYNRLEVLKQKHIGKIFNSFTILDVFYGPDRGYKTRGFLVEYKNICGHDGITSLSILKKHKKNITCHSCAKTTHGERKKIEGILKKRTRTYSSWVTLKKDLPSKFNAYIDFLDEVGEKPAKNAKLTRITEDKYVWVDNSVSNNTDLNLISTAIRQVFRYSSLYKNCIESSKVESDKKTLYRCAKCGGLSNRKDIQVDHIDPIMPITGVSLTKDTLIDRIWTDGIQILDRKCHTEKSTYENKLRKENRKKLL